MRSESKLKDYLFVLKQNKRVAQNKDIESSDEAEEEEVPQTEEEKKSADGFKATHTKSRLFENSGNVDIKKNFPFVGPQGIKIGYSFDEKTQTMELDINKTNHANWKKDVEPQVYDFLGQLLEV